jgi:hypothetical protein
MEQAPAAQIASTPAITADSRATSPGTINVDAAALTRSDNEKDVV